jgi:hypothetical protein
MTAAEQPERPGVAVWEPWVPVVGQRVRFRDSGECPLTSPYMRNGMVGVVYHVEEPLSENGVEPWHRFWVSFGDATAYCAAAELEPLTTEADR